MNTLQISFICVGMLAFVMILLLIMSLVAKRSGREVDDETTILRQDPLNAYATDIENDEDEDDD
jgi:hypothetical protein